MRTLNIYILLFSMLLVVACSKEDKKLVINEIPDEDRCIFTEGDVLLYSCSNGSTDTIVVVKVDFKTESGTTTFGGKPLDNYLIDTQSMIIESSNDNWEIILRNVNALDDDNGSRCLRIETIPSYTYQENYPWCEILTGCVMGDFNMANGINYQDEKIFNNKSYNKVYNESRGDLNNGYEIYWNLKYGIISFVGISNSTKLTWLFDKIL